MNRKIFIVFVKNMDTKLAIIIASFFGAGYFVGQEIFK